MNGTLFTVTSVRVVDTTFNFIKFLEMSAPGIVRHKSKQVFMTEALGFPLTVQVSTVGAIVYIIYMFSKSFTEQ